MMAFSLRSLTKAFAVYAVCTISAATVFVEEGLPNSGVTLNKYFAASSGEMRIVKDVCVENPIRNFDGPIIVPETFNVLFWPNTSSHPRSLLWSKKRGGNWRGIMLDPVLAGYIEIKSFCVCSAIVDCIQQKSPLVTRSIIGFDGVYAPVNINEGSLSDTHRFVSLFERLPLFSQDNNG
jgi:hypothetical protein